MVSSRSTVMGPQVHATTGYKGVPSSSSATGSVTGNGAIVPRTSSASTSGHFTPPTKAYTGEVRNSTDYRHGPCRYFHRHTILVQILNPQTRIGSPDTGFGSASVMSVYTSNSASASELGYAPREQNITPEGIAFTVSGWWSEVRPGYSQHITCLIQTPEACNTRMVPWIPLHTQNV
jgi:hypothetical protein